MPSVAFPYYDSGMSYPDHFPTDCSSARMAIPFDERRTMSYLFPQFHLPSSTVILGKIMPCFTGPGNSRVFVSTLFTTFGENSGAVSQLSNQ